MNFFKMNEKPIEIEYEYPYDDEELDPIVFFRFDGEKYYLYDFIRCHNNPWVGENNFPDYIHGYNWYTMGIFAPMYIEITDDEYINVYGECGLDLEEE